MVVEAQSVCILLLFCWFVVAALCSSIHLKKKHTHTNTSDVQTQALSSKNSSHHPGIRLWAWYARTTTPMLIWYGTRIPTWMVDSYGKCRYLEPQMTPSFRRSTPIGKYTIHGFYMGRMYTLKKTYACRIYAWICMCTYEYALCTYVYVHSCKENF